MRDNLWQLLCLCLCVVPNMVRAQQVAPLTPPVAAFRDGDTIAFLGDSITAGGIWERDIIDYYRTQHPGWTLHWINAGYPGDRASRAVADRRIDHDIAPMDPNVVVVMFGMNDVSRGLYGMSAPTPEVLQQRQQRLTEFDHSMRAIVSKLKQSPTVRSIVLIASSPYDETSLGTIPPVAGVNEGIEASGQIVKSIARDASVSFLDFYHPMLAVLKDGQAKDSRFSFNMDRVHPNPAGQLLMASLFLEAQQESLRTTIHVGSSVYHSSCGNCKLRGVAWGKRELTFETVEQGLPTPVEDDASAALSWSPSVLKSHQGEELAVDLPAGWGPGLFDLNIDGNLVGRFKSAELRKGINLASLAASPQIVKAKAILKRDDQQSSVMHLLAEWRALAYMAQLGDQSDTATTEQLRSAMQAWFEKKISKPGANEDYFYSLFKRISPKMEEQNVLRSRIRESDSPLFPEAGVQPHVYRIQSVADGNAQ